MAHTREDGYRAFVGTPAKYSLRGALCFDLLARLGLRENHILLEVGCGSLSAGKLLIPYLLPGRYCGVEPEEWLIEDALREELGEAIVAVKRPRFHHSREFDLGHFGINFDYILACSIATHCGMPQLKAFMGAAAGVLKDPGGVLLATAHLGREDGGASEWTYPGYASWTKATLRRLGEQEGLDVEFKNSWPAPGTQTWMVVTWDGRPMEPVPFITL